VAGANEGPALSAYIDARRQSRKFVALFETWNGLIMVELLWVGRRTEEARWLEPDRTVADRVLLANIGQSASCRPLKDIDSRSHAELATISPVNAVKRAISGFPARLTETVCVPARTKAAISFVGPLHLLILYHEGSRSEGLATVSGLAPSKLRTVTSRLTFVPAGSHFREAYETRSATRTTFLYLPAEQLEEPETSPNPNIHFEDQLVWETAVKLSRTLESGTDKQLSYVDALSKVLLHELTRAEMSVGRSTFVCKGGLASWQKRAVISYIEDHLADQICLTTLAELVRLSQHHFCRAFKQSFGVPPHQYHVKRRIERAKLLLADRKMSITDVGLIVGYSQASSFSLAFRKMTGGSPSEYRRGVEE
jgi:AraC family transcriptional regulator